MKGGRGGFSSALPLVHSNVRMDRTIFALIAAGLFLLTGAQTVQAQYVTGSVSMAGVAGYQSNPYLDPMVGEWDPAVDPAFFALEPAGRLTWSSADAQATLRGWARIYPDRMDRATLPVARGTASGRYQWAERWSVGGQAGFSRYRLRAERNTWWVLPSLRWAPTNRTALSLHTGVTGRRTGLATETPARQRSAVGVVAGNAWLSDRVQAQLSLYRSGSRTATTDATYGGTGLTAAATYWIANRLTLTAHATFEQIRSEIVTESDESGPPVDIPGDGPSSTTTIEQTDRLWRAGVEVEWMAGRHLTVFARAQGMQANLSSTADATPEGHLSGGVRLRLSGTLRRPDVNAAWHGVWRTTDAGVRFRIRYRGPGRLYVTGDFNNWADPGIPLQSDGSNRHAATLDLEPGRYEYRIRVVENGEERWLDLPSDARTVDDGFGGKNGVCIVE